MSDRTRFPIIGLAIGSTSALAINLLAASVYDIATPKWSAFARVIVFAAFTLTGIVVEHWLRTHDNLSASHAPQAAIQPSSEDKVSAATRQVAVTRLVSILSWLRIRGLSVRLDRIFTLASHLAIESDTNDEVKKPPPTDDKSKDPH